MNDQEEYYFYFERCIQSLNNARIILKIIKEDVSQCKLIIPAFQFALIEYSKPYKISIGFANKYKLSEDHIPAEYMELHKRVVDARDQIHAHSDLTVLEAKLYVKNTPNGKIVGYVQNAIRGTEELSNLNIIIELIEKTLDNMYVKQKKLESELPEN